jgi:hypothetical protein
MEEAHKFSNEAVDSYILIEGPRWGDAEFLGKWLLAASRANELLTRVREEAAFQGTMSAVDIIHVRDFGISATVVLSKLAENFSTVLFSLEELDTNDVAIMAELGFYQRTGDRYQMTLPTRLDIRRVKTALGKFVETEDPEYFLHPEKLIRTIRVSEGKAWQERLKQMDEDQRLADRDALLW